MNFVIIRNQKTDSFTMHATTCRAAVAHAVSQFFADAPDTIEQCLADMATYADECGWDKAPEVKICKCARK